jgi:hypothetical protein
MHATFPVHPTLIFGEQYKLQSSSICNHLHSPVTSSLLGPNILTKTLFSKLGTQNCKQEEQMYKDKGEVIHVTDHYIMKKHTEAKLNTFIKLRI